jgi:hypothetical protein
VPLEGSSEFCARTRLALLLVHPHPEISMRRLTQGRRDRPRQFHGQLIMLARLLPIGWKASAFLQERDQWPMDAQAVSSRRLHDSARGVLRHVP